MSFELPDLPARPIDFDGLLASMNATAVLDRRYSVFDPTRGWFYSTSLQWGLQAVGSDFDYLRTLIRVSYYQPIGPLMLASNARWGHLQPRGGTPPLTVFDVFFKAGGTQTVRGDKQDELSAYNAFGVPLGGTRLVVFNEEIRGARSILSSTTVDQAANFARLAERPCVTRTLNVHGFHSNTDRFGPRSVHGSDALEIQDLMGVTGVTTA